MEKMCVTKPLYKTVSLRNKCSFFPPVLFVINRLLSNYYYGNTGHVAESNENEEERAKLSH